MNKIPLIDVKAKKETEKVQIEAYWSNAKHQDSIYAHTPNFPRRSSPSFIALILQNGYVIGLKRFSFLRGAEFQTKIEFHLECSVPVTEFAELLVLCDSYIGIDQEFPIY